MVGLCLGYLTWPTEDVALNVNVYRDGAEGFSNVMFKVDIPTGMLVLLSPTSHTLDIDTYDLDKVTKILGVHQRVYSTGNYPFEALRNLGERINRDLGYKGRDEGLAF